MRAPKSSEPTPRSGGRAAASHLEPPGRRTLNKPMRVAKSRTRTARDSHAPPHRRRFRVDDAAAMSIPRTMRVEFDTTIGIEEEFFLVDRDTWDCVLEMPEAF